MPPEEPIKVKWPKKTRSVGVKSGKVYALYFSQEFMDALQEFAADESDKAGFKVSPSNVLSTSALLHNSELRRLYRQHLEKHKALNETKPNGN